MNSDNFNNIASGVQSIVISVGIFMTGLWALYTFIDSRVQSLDLSMTTKIFSEDSGKYIVVVALEVTNDGNVDSTIMLGEGSLIITRIQPVKGKSLEVLEVNSASNYSLIRGEINVSRKILVTPKADRKIHYFLEVDQPGLYYIELKSIQKNKRSWSVDTYVYIDKTP